MTMQSDGVDKKRSLLDPSTIPDDKKMSLPDPSMIDDIAKLVIMPLASFILLFFICIDIHQARKKKARWVPGGWLLLGSFTLTLLQLSSHGVPSIRSDWGADFQDGKISISDAVITLVSSRLISMSGRVSFCIFVAFVLPFVSNTADVVSLFVNASIVIIHSLSNMVVSIKVLNKVNNQIMAHEYTEAIGRSSNSDTIEIVPEPFTFNYLVTTEIIVTCCVILILCCFCSSVCASKSLQEMIDLRRAVLFRPSEIHNECESWCQTKVKLLKYCFFPRIYHPTYIVARSVLTSLVFFLATVCLVVLLIDKWLSVRTPLGLRRMCYLIISDFKHGSQFVVLLFEGIFSLCGWVAMSRRWITSFIFTPTDIAISIQTSKAKDECEKLRKVSFPEFFQVEDFWIRSLKHLQNCNDSRIGFENIYAKFLWRMIRKTKLYKIVSLLIVLQKLMVLCSKFCWLISHAIFFKDCTVRFSMGSTLYKEYCCLLSSALPESNTRNGHRHPPHVEYCQFSKFLSFLPSQSPVGVWIENLDWLCALDKLLDKGKHCGRDALELAMLIKHASNDPSKSTRLVHKYMESFPETLSDMEDQLYMGCGSLKMAAISLLQVMAELSNLCNVTSIIYQGDRDFVKKHLRACEEAWAVMDFVESSNQELEAFGKAADQLFIASKDSIPTRLSLGNRVQKDVVKSLEKKAKEMVEEEFQHSTHYENWKAGVNAKHLWETCARLLDTHDGDNFIQEAEEALAALVSFAIQSCEEAFYKKIKMQRCISVEQMVEACFTQAFAQGVREIHIPSVIVHEYST